MALKIEQMDKWRPPAETNLARAPDSEVGAFYGW